LYSVAIQASEITFKEILNSSIPPVKYSDEPAELPDPI
jgi:hypothetical protein